MRAFSYRPIGDPVYDGVLDAVKTFVRTHPHRWPDFGDLVHTYYLYMVSRADLEQIRNISSFAYLVVRRAENHNRNKVGRRDLMLRTSLPCWVTRSVTPPIDEHVGDVDCVAKALRQLSKLSKKVVEMSLEGYTPAEIATLLGVKERRIILRKHRALKSMRKVLEQGAVARPGPRC